MRTIDSTWIYPNVMIRDVLKNINDGKSCMVLGYCSYLLEPLIAELKEQGVPFHNPYRKSAYHWNPLAQGRDDQHSASDRLKAYRKPVTSPDLWTPAELKLWFECIKTTGICPRGYRKKILEIEGINPLTVEQLSKFIIIDWLIKLETSDYAYHHLTDRLMAGYGNIAYAARVAEKHGMEMLDGGQKLVIGTIHSVKGAEADVVYIFPDVTASILRTAEMSQSKADALVGLYYVAITRAKEQVVICKPVTAGQCVDLEDYF